jgi:sn-glycerol 3-phosphate transport system ATP-binding protein
VIVQAEAGTALTPGTRIGLSLPPERTYYFDAISGESLRASAHVSPRQTIAPDDFAAKLGS